MAEITALLTGAHHRAEFREAVETLRSLCHLVRMESVAAAEAKLAEGLAPDVIILAQAFPGQITAEDVDRLRRLAPLARVVGLLGSWCEGEVRTGKPWPAVPRVYWHQWSARCRRDLRNLVEGRCSHWALPSTATDEERFLALAERPFAHREGLIALYAAQFEMHQWIMAACRRRGYTTVWMRGRQPAVVTGAKALIFDFEGEIEAERDELCRLDKVLGPTVILTLVNFPRIDDKNRLLEAGAAAVLSKPLLLEDLYGELDRLVG